MWRPGLGFLLEGTVHAECAERRRESGDAGLYDDGQVAQRLGGGAEVGDRGEGRLDELVAQLLRAVDAGEFYERQTVGIFADVLAEILWVAGHVEDVIGDLEREAEVFGENFDAAQGGGRGVGEHRADRGGGDEKGAGLARVDELQRIEIESRRFAVQVDRFAGDRAVPSDGVDDALDHLQHRPLARSQRGVVLRHQSVRVIEERYRRQDGQVFAELAVQRRLSAAEKRVVHRRQVIQYQ